MSIFERRVPLTEEQRTEVEKQVEYAGKTKLESVVGGREQLEFQEGKELQDAIDLFFQSVIRRADQREFFGKEEREQLVQDLAVKIEAVLSVLEAMDQRRLASFISDEPQTVEETLKSFKQDLDNLEAELSTSPDEIDESELSATRDDIQFFRTSLWRQVQLGHLRLDDVMSQEERETFAQDVEVLGERAGVAQTGKTVQELAEEAAAAMVGEYERMLVAHKVVIGLESKYSEEEILNHLQEVVPSELSIDFHSVISEIKSYENQGKPDHISSLSLYFRLIAKLFEGKLPQAAGFSGGMALLGYLAPQLAGQFGEFGRTGSMKDAAEGAGFGVMSSLAQVEFSRRLSMFLNERMYAETGIAPQLLDAVLQSSPDLFTRQDRTLVRKYIEDAVESVERIAQHSIEGLGGHLSRVVGFSAASVVRLNNPMLFGPVALATLINTYLAMKGGKAISEVDDDVREAASVFATRFDEAVEVRVGRGEERRPSEGVISRLKEARDRLVNTASRYQHGQGMVMPLVLLLNAMLMDRSKPDFFANYAEGSMYSMQLSTELSSLVSDFGRVRQSLQPLLRISKLVDEFRESGHIMPKKWDMEFTDIRLKKLSVPHFKVSAGDLITVVGESGSGKSTFFEMLYGFSPDRGLVLIDEMPKSKVNMRTYREGIAASNQFYAIETVSFIDNVISDQVPFDENIFEEVVREHRFEHWIRQVGKADEKESLTSIGRRLILNRDVKLSGGERKNFGIMTIDYRMRVASDTVKMILLDEPTSGADEILKQSIFEMIARWRKEHPEKTIVIANHDPAMFPHLPADSRLLGIEKDGRLSQDTILSAAREQEGLPFHRIFRQK